MCQRHELHLLVLSPPYRYSVRSNLVMNDEEGIISELKLFQAAGGNTVCDMTSIGLRINSEALRRVSKATGVNIVAGTAFYLDSFLSEDHKMLSVREVSPAALRIPMHLCTHACKLKKCF